MSLVFTVFLQFCGLHLLLAQNIEIKPLIKAWETADTSQTHRAEETYAALKIHGKDRYLAAVPELYAYLDKHPDPRLKVRVIMYDILGKSEFKIQKNKADLVKMGEAVKAVHQVQDDQLTAELYSQLAEMDFNGDFLLYNLKALELQQSVGMDHFSFVYNRFFGASLALYRTADYRQSIAYGTRGLQLRGVKIKNWDPRIYVFQLDILGASYLELAKYDSAKYYYGKIIELLETKPDKDPNFQRLWLGIAKGDIGRILASQGHYKEAEPLIQQHLETSIALESWNNMAMAQNALAEIRLGQKKYTEALDGFRNAYYWSLKDDKLNNRIDASKGLGDVYRLTGYPDSAYHYYNLYHEYRDTLSAKINRKRYSVANSRISFDNTQRHLEKANATLSQERLIRNFILAAIALLTLIALLLYNYRMQKVKHREEEMDRKRKTAEEEVKRAKSEIAGFTKRIVEKNNLILELQKDLEAVQVPSDTEVAENLMKYTLVTDAEWEKFRQEFSKVYPKFLPALKRNIVQVNPAEERLAALMFLQLSPYQIANTLGISKDSVARSKRRLKQRLNLSAEADLEAYLNALS